jgi:hypothetical protein
VIKFGSDLWWFSPGTLVSSTNKTNSHDIAEILLKVALKTITLTPNISSRRNIRLKTVLYYVPQEQETREGSMVSPISS